MSLISKITSWPLRWYNENWPGNTTVVILPRFNPYNKEHWVTIYDKIAWRYLLWNHFSDYEKVIFNSCQVWNGYYYTRRKWSIHRLPGDIVKWIKIFKESNAHYARIKTFYEGLS